MEILWFKVLTILSIFAVALFAGHSPTRMRVSERGERQLMWGNAFSGGIFLGAGLLHMLPDARVNFAVYAGDIDFPFPALLCGVGFLLILLLEKAALGGSHDVGKAAEGRPASPFLLCLILSVHSIIAGTSLGLEATLVSATAIFIAIIAHKGAASFALGVSLRESKFPSYRHMVIKCCVISECSACADLSSCPKALKLNKKHMARTDNARTKEFFVFIKPPLMIPRLSATCFGLGLKRSTQHRH